MILPASEAFCKPFYKTCPLRIVMNEITFEMHGNASSKCAQPAAFVRHCKPTDCACGGPCLDIKIGQRASTTQRWWIIRNAQHAHLRAGTLCQRTSQYRRAHIANKTTSSQDTSRHLFRIDSGSVKILRLACLHALGHKTKGKGNLGRPSL